MHRVGVYRLVSSVMGEYLWLQSWSQFRRLFREKTCRMSLSPSPQRRTDSLSGLFAKRRRVRASRSGKSLIRKSHYFDEISLMCSLWECKPARRSIDMNGIPDFFFFIFLGGWRGEGAEPPAVIMSVNKTTVTARTRKKVLSEAEF